MDRIKVLPGVQAWRWGGDSTNSKTCRHLTLLKSKLHSDALSNVAYLKTMMTI